MRQPVHSSSLAVHKATCVQWRRRLACPHCCSSSFGPAQPSALQAADWQLLLSLGCMYPACTLVVLCSLTSGLHLHGGQVIELLQPVVAKCPQTDAGANKSSCRFGTRFSAEYHSELLGALESLLQASRGLPLSLQFSCLCSAAALTSCALPGCCCGCSPQLGTEPS